MILDRQPAAPPRPGAPNTGANLAEDAKRAAERRDSWDAFFAAAENPWRYDSSYEVTKYRQTLDLLPAGPIARALELACAEGHFTVDLAARVGRLIAGDISAVALGRARARCAALPNVEFRRIDYISETLPQDLDLLVCSETLYYTPPALLAGVAAGFAAALTAGGHLLMAHPNVITDGRGRTGFDWGTPGVQTIARVFAATAAFSLIRELRTPLYRIQLYRRNGPGIHPPAAPEIIEARHGALPIRVESQVVWGGAICTRAEAQREEAHEIPILLYHSIANDGPSELDPYRVTPAVFRQHLRLLRRLGYHSISLDEWAACIAARTPLRGRPVVITFDDGYKNFIKHAAPLLERADFRATVFVATERVGGVADWDKTEGPPLELMDWDDLRSLEARGFLVASHTTAHRDLTKLADDEIERDSVEARATLRRELGHDVAAIAFPWGRHNARVRAALARGGYRLAVDVTPCLSTLSDDVGCLPRIEIFAEDGLDDFARKLPRTLASVASPRPAKPPAPPDRAKPPPSRHFLYIAEAMRRSPYRAEAERGFFQFRGNDVFLHPPREGRSRVQASDIAPGAATAVFGCVLSLDQSCAGPVRFCVRLADRIQSTACEAVVKPGETRDISLILEGFDGPLSIELTTEMAAGPGANSRAWATFGEPHIHYLCGLPERVPAPGAVSPAGQGC
ncbi:MAG TPA: polysaccharide deacetylase family protein [Stellaceae bacterium]|nr:polysaccharide deacetylase family protein [Stellaceae bacterium]